MEIAPRMTATCEELKENRLTCSDCNTVTRCVYRDGHWDSYDVETCGDDYSCNINEQKCSNATSFCNNLPTFVCFAEGKFPDPFNCRKYYTCVFSSPGRLAAIESVCLQNSAYDVQTEACSLNITSNVCFEPGFTCEEAGDIGAWARSSTIFYVCERIPDSDDLIPRLSACGFGEIFDGTGCINSNSSPTPSPTLSPTQTTDGPSGTPPAGGEEFVCLEKGTFIDPQNCSNYFICDALLNVRALSCPPGTVFSLETNACRLGSC